MQEVNEESVHVRVNDFRKDDEYLNHRKFWSTYKITNKEESLKLLTEQLIYWGKYDIICSNTNGMFYEDSLNAVILCICDGPGKFEDSAFSSKNWELFEEFLTGELEGKVPYGRHYIYPWTITEEGKKNDVMSIMSFYTGKLLEIIKPKCVVVLGKTALNVLMRYGCIFKPEDVAFNGKNSRNCDNTVVTKLQPDTEYAFIKAATFSPHPFYIFGDSLKETEKEKILCALRTNIDTEKHRYLISVGREKQKKINGLDELMKKEVKETKIEVKDGVTNIEEDPNNMYSPRM